MKFSLLKDKTVSMEEGPTLHPANKNEDFCSNREVKNLKLTRLIQFMKVVFYVLMIFCVGLFAIAILPQYISEYRYAVSRFSNDTTDELMMDHRNDDNTTIISHIITAENITRSNVEDDVTATSTSNYEDNGMFDSSNDEIIPNEDSEMSTMDIDQTNVIMDNSTFDPTMPAILIPFLRHTVEDLDDVPNFEDWSDDNDYYLDDNIYDDDAFYEDLF